jgi:hypothetical protein
MRPIRSIIVFNSASAGDFLTSLCWSQLGLPDDLFDQESSGRMNTTRHWYFKKITTEIFYNADSVSNLDYNKILPVENSHYWLDCYKTIADRCVFIDYSDAVQENIMQIYLEKVFDNSRQQMLEFNRPYQDSSISKHLTVDNIEKVLNLHWKKNLKNWRNNTAMSCIDLEDFFDKSKIQRIVEKLIDQDLANQDKFDDMYNNWILKNPKLAGLFDK